MKVKRTLMIDPEISSSRDIKYPDWQREFEAALRERDPKVLRERVDAAEAAIFLRLQTLANGSNEQAEQEAISNALRTLRTFQREKLNYPDWNKK
jgi:hypothetical protein